MDWLDKNGPEPRLPDLKYDNKQLFFIGYAQVWYTLKCHLFKIINIDSIPLELVFDAYPTNVSILKINNRNNISYNKHTSASPMTSGWCFYR